ncbi:MAG: GNAT family N-acetyltransferase [Pseudomonadota bacterium]
MSEAFTGIDVRQAVPEDADACAAILNDWIDRTDWMPRVHTHADVARYYRDVLFTEQSVWVEGRPVAGFLALEPQTAYVTALYVATPGQGIGRALLDRAKSERRTLSLWTFVANIPARRFYARAGFHEVRRTAGDNEEQLPDILLRWEGPGDG